MLFTKLKWSLWGVWISWGSTIVCFILSKRTPMFISMIATGAFALLLLLSFLHKKRMDAQVLSFTRKEEEPATEKAAPAVSMVQSQSPAAMIGDDINIKETTISPGTVLRGEIANENNITINGVVEGDITSQKMIQIGKEGKVLGTVKSARLVINGLLQGSCHAGTVIIMSRGRVEGDIHASELSIEKGGSFIGVSHQVEEAVALPNKKEKKPNEPVPKGSPALVAVEDKLASSPQLAAGK